MLTFRNCGNGYTLIYTIIYFISKIYDEESLIFANTLHNNIEIIEKITEEEKRYRAFEDLMLSGKYSNSILMCAKLANLSITFNKNHFKYINFTSPPHYKKLILRKCFFVLSAVTFDECLMSVKKYKNRKFAVF